MSTGAPQRAEVLFYEALELPPGEREAFLNNACGANASLRGEVDELLRAHDGAASFLHVDAPAPPELEAEFARLKPEEVGERIGNYKLLEQIGEGGFGVVWVAEQEKPMRRRVALKIIKLGMDTKAVIARFEQERQALAMMDHPNIAKVLDAGATPFGRPFFVMELVRGIKITEYCDQAHLPTEERLRLFIAVCHAVQHAHQKGIIHRDLKPSNILVTLHDGVPVPKVIDFGVAKATQQQRLTDLTVYTQFEQMIGTPLYMNPEQAEMTGLDIDTRSDIYSLGVLLYELLVGRTPFDPEELMKRGVDEIRRVVREQEPQKPSTFVSTMAADMRTNLAQHRQTDGARLVGQIRGDLDWIVMKALEKDRSRRYETATGLAQDILRHLQSEPVQARPPTALYRFRRMVRRNKLAFAAASAVLAALLCGLGISTWMFFKEKDARERAVAAEKAQSEERKKAESEANKGRHVARFLQDMLAGVGPSVALGRDTTLLREILDKTVERVGKDLKDQPEVEAELRDSLGNVHHALAEYAKAEAMLREALAIRKKQLGNEHPDVAASLTNLARVFQRQGKLAEAETMLREALAMGRKLLGGEHPQVATALSRLASVLHDQGKLAEAETMFREALAMQKKRLGSEHPDVATTLSAFASAFQRQGKLAEAEPMFREALAMQRKLLGNEHPDVGRTLNNFALVLQYQGKLAEAEPMLREALAMQKKLLGNEHPDVAIYLSNFASVFQRQGKLAEAEPMFREALAMQKKLLGSEHPHVAKALGLLASVLKDQRKLVEAEPMFREALAMKKKLLANEHPDVAAALGHLASVLQDQGKLAEAEAMHREALAMQRKLVGNEHPNVATTLNNLADVLAGQRKFAEAESMLREALEMVRKLFGNEHPNVAVSLSNLGTMLRDQDKLAEAESMLREALAMVSKLLGNEHRDVAPVLFNLAGVLLKQGRFTDAETMYLEVLAMERKLLGNEHPKVATSLHDLAAALSSQKGKLAEAEAMHREALAMRKKLLGNEHPQVGESLHSLAHVLETDGNLAQAESMLREALAVRRKQFGEADPEVAKTPRCLAKVIKNEGKLGEAETMYREDLATRRKLLGNEHPDVAISLNELGPVLVSQGKLAEAESTYREALAIVRESANSDPKKLEAILASLAEFHFRQGQYAESEPFYRELVASRQARLPPEAADVLMPTASLARLLADWAWSERSSASKLPGSKLKIAERAREAERLLRESLAIRLRATVADPWRIADVRSRLGGALMVVAVTDLTLTNEARLAILSEAETLLLEGHEGLLKGKKSDLKYKQDSFTRLVRIYQAWDKPNQAAEWQQKLDDFNQLQAQPETGAKVDSPQL